MVKRRSAYAVFAMVAVVAFGSVVLTGQRAAAERPCSARSLPESPQGGEHRPAGDALAGVARAREARTGTDPAGAVATTPLAAGDDASSLQRAPGCPADMVLVEGEYCAKARHHCLDWLDDPKLPYARCGQYERPARCAGKRERLRFCIDRYEQTLPGEALPTNYMSFNLASRLCRRLGRRICWEKEWNFACEGELMRPYPYGWSRQPLCNQDREDLYEENPKRQVLRDLREGARTRPECASPFGVVNMVGNLDEPVLREIARYNIPFRNALKGGWWMAGRNRCRPATVGHDDDYRDIQIGARCCTDAEPNEAAVGSETGREQSDRAGQEVVHEPSSRSAVPEALHGARGTASPKPVD